jgi:hypothetical protein
MPQQAYCIDASSLLKMKEDFPRKVFPGLWDRVEQLIRDGRLFAPEEVFKEVEMDDEISEWLLQQRAMFKKIDGELWEVAKQIAARFPAIAKPGKFGPAADPFVIGLARSHNDRRTEQLFDRECECAVVTEEGGGAERIPAVCVALDVKCISLVDLFKEEGWVFS